MSVRGAVLGAVGWIALAASGSAQAGQILDGGPAQPDPIALAQPPADLPVRDRGRANARGEKGKAPPARPEALLTFVDSQSTWVAPPPPAPPDLSSVTTGILQCVPYARAVSGIGLRGDAWTWWDKAAGVFARGNRPEPGAVLSFPGIDRMPLGHVAVVHQVLGPKKILIDHANWPNAVVQHGAISKDIEVVDLSPANDWTEVRVQFGEGGPMGSSVYPANGFIYGWSETGVQVAHPHFSLDYALWPAGLSSWRMFNAINYVWVLPPKERQQAYAAAGMIPESAGAGRGGRPVLVLGTPSMVLSGSAFAPVVGINRFSGGPGERAIFTLGRFAVR